MYTVQKELLAVIVATILSVHSVQTATVEKAQSRIVGGLPANDVNIPYVVSLMTYGFHTCGGSIINERTVLTAGHCLAYTTPRLLKVHAGAKSRSVNEGELISVLAVHYHPQWSSETMDYDIGMVRLVTPLVFSATIQPILLPRSDYIIRDGSIAVVSGWGYMNVMGPGSDMLRYARVPIVNQRTCNRLLSNKVTDRMICAGYALGGIDACQMDSGGPLVVSNKLIGVVSWGVGCALPNRPGVYTRVSAFLPWINQILVKDYNEMLIPV